MKSIVLLLLMSFTFPLQTFSQLKKAEKYLRKERYEEALQAVRKTRSSSENRRTLLEIQVKSYYGLYQQTKKIFYLDKCLGYSVQLIKLEPTSLDQPFIITVQEELDKSSVACYEKGDSRRAKNYVASLASSFKDTASLYEKLYPKVLKSEADVSQSKNSFVIVSGNMTRPAMCPSRKSVVGFSEKFVGKPYKWGGEDSSGFDCSGFVLYVMRKYGYNFNHSAKDQSELGREVVRDSLQPCDLVFFGKKYSTGKYKIDHVAMVYTANADQLVLIHSTSRGVNIQEVKEGDYWHKKLLFYRNIMN